MANILCGNPKCKKPLKVNIKSLDSNNPLVTCPFCKQVSRIKIPPQAKSKAWLVRHTENLPIKTYDLKIGKNIIGRKALDPSYAIPNIAITKDEDQWISRGIHCSLEVQINNDEISVILSDNSSTNGTFINEKEYRLNPGDEEYIEDGETIQVGRTKFVLKTDQNVKSSQEASTVVQNSRYSQTIIM
jgi:hypothetical protein